MIKHPHRKGLKGWLLNRIESRGYLLLNRHKEQARNIWLRELGIRTVLDVGANTGESALEFHQMLPDAQVHSFEPLPDSFATMQANLAEAGNWWYGHNLALGPKTGTSVIHRSEYSLSSSLLPMGELHKQAYPYTAGSSEQIIEVARLDDVAAKAGWHGPILLKLDVQGYEMPALEGAMETLAQCQAVICETSFLELYQGQRLYQDVAQFLQEQGLYYAGSAGQRNSPLNGRPLQQDAIFLRKGV